MQKSSNDEGHPPVVRSRLHLIEQGVSFAPKDALAPTQLPITADGTTYSMAQEVTWLDEQHFAVGRWDGSLGIFAFNPSQTAGPLITTAASSPSMEGVQMMVWLAPGVFASSNDEGSISVWTSPEGSWKDLRQARLLHYDSELGVANSGESFELGATLYLVVGHANGYLSIWSGEAEGCDLKLVTTVDVRAARPVNPWSLHNIRGVSLISKTNARAWVVTGSEDGNLSIVQIPEGIILSTTVYNPAAQRGINSIASLGQKLLVANCSVGPDDKNLWYYDIDPESWEITLRDSVNLKVNPAAPQVFNFCTIWGLYADGHCFFASTEEGALWMGTIKEDSKLDVFGYREVTSSLGSALAFNAGGRLVMVSYNLYEFITGSGRPIPRFANPERLQ